MRSVGTLGTLVILAAIAVTACGGRVPPCAVPATPEAAWRALDGTWRVITWSDELNGTILFDGDHVEATSEDTRFVGHWSPVSSTDNAHVLRLAFEEATIADVRQVWADPTVLDVTVVFATTDLVWGLQPDGAWTRWERIGGCVDTSVGCGQIDHPPDALQRLSDDGSLDASAGPDDDVTRATDHDDAPPGSDDGTPEPPESETPTTVDGDEEPGDNEPS
jgi:hypothetical protein